LEVEEEDDPGPFQDLWLSIKKLENYNSLGVE
jgi:hypothetical protein